jgi:ABC-type multidrug transport system fused ATPase/permease subunit
MKLTRVKTTKGIFARSLGILSKSDRRKLFFVACIQVVLGIMDLVGVLCIGLLGTLSVSNIQGSEPTGKVSVFLQTFGIENMSSDKQLILVGALAIFLLVGRTLLSIFFTQRVLYFLSRRGALLSANLVSRVLKQSLLFIQSKTIQEILYALTRGVEIITLEILATSIVLVADVSLLIIMLIGLLYIDPIAAVSVGVLFSLISMILYLLMNVRAKRLGERSTQLNIISSEKIVEVLNSYREAVVGNRRDFYSQEIGKLRFSLADTLAEFKFMPYVSKYVIETSVILGALVIGGSQLLINDASQAISTLAIFMAAGTRIAPAILRIQQTAIQIRGNIGMAGPTLSLIEEIGVGVLPSSVLQEVIVDHKGFESKILVEKLTFSYPGAKESAICDVSLSIDAGQSIAIVGPSGAGKTTLVDLILGVIEPNSGSIKISGVNPLEACERWPGAIAYVPQDVVIIAGTVRQNIGIGYALHNASDELVLKSLRIANLESFVMGLEKNLESQVGEKGAKLSGGQRQRLGIARALFTNPGLLVFDEATSALDAETEETVSNAIQSLRGKTTVIMIAHRLSTVRSADQVIYMDRGKVVASGSFESVRSQVPDFDHQAKLMGL